MSQKIYPISPAKIGNQDGFRLPRGFSKDHPELVNAAGEVEVLDEKTLLVRLDVRPLERDEDEDESLIMGLFLDFLMNEAISQRSATRCADPESLVPYTEAMSQQVDELLAAVVVE
jgi:antitoxin PrlF